MLFSKVYVCANANAEIFALLVCGSHFTVDKDDPCENVFHTTLAGHIAGDMYCICKYKVSRMGVWCNV